MESLSLHGSDAPATGEAKSARHNLLYFGDNNFRRTFRELNALKASAARARERQAEEERVRAQEHAGDFDFLYKISSRFGTQQVNLEPDREEIFLSQFAGMQRLY